MPAHPGFWKDKSVLVTGAGGFIGSHLSERLVTEGAKVRAFIHYNGLGDRRWLQGSSAEPEVDFYFGDIRDRDSVREAAKGFEVVFHLAALIGIPYSYKAPESYVDTNIGGTLNVLQCAKELGTARVIHTSTSEVYGTAQFVPITEEHPLTGQSPYSATKIGADKIAESFFLSFGTPVTTVRPFNTYGPRQSARAIIPTIVTQFLKGNVAKLGSLTPTRDLNFVSDTVDGFLKAAESGSAVGQTINLGSGQEISIGDLFNLIANLMGVEAEVEVERARLRPEGSEVQRLLASNQRAQDVLGWESRVSLEDGLGQTIEWIRANQDRFRVGTFAV